ncbi:MULTISPECIES: DNA-directed RNA polymerase subunit alpha C-terminal domain-containing protein [Bradyrhizobium]|uniref:DNA-directed RNA polymerase subunit alpha C-terminal domain-containing protein n=1 Tax=Bradyrhizobium TaxID=374 RepID=UPI0014854FA4|nr:DNA-directed RNA polymerase subunit alpha C-terminal domain-containing protein [Bradyrhizobium elkanii]
MSSGFAQTIELPELSEDADLRILDLEIEKLEKSDTYPYGLTRNKLDKLREAGFATIGQLADATDAELLRIDTIGTKSLNRIKDVVYQAIWM